MWCQPALPKDHVDERPTNSPVSVDERMDGFELRVRYCRPDDGWQRVIVAKSNQVIEQLTHLVRRRRDKSGRARVVAVSAYPALLGSDVAAVVAERGWCK